ncbi:MAG: AMP-binding protein [Acidimicrobiales bacterium]
MDLNQLRRLDLALRRRLTLADFADRLADVWGDRLLVDEFGGDRLTYAEAAARVSTWSNGFAARIGPGDRVVVATPNAYEQFLLCMAVSRAGGLPVPVNPQMRESEVDHVVSDSGAAFVVHAADELDPDAEPCEPARPDRSDVAALFYTSGTTGKPKGVALTHQALVGQTAAAALWPVQLRHDEVVVALPVAHIMGFVTLVGLATAGLPVYFMGRFRPNDVLNAIESRRSSGFVGVPAMYRMMHEAGAARHDLRSVRVWMSGADVMPSELAREFKGYGASVHLPLLGDRGEAAFVEGYGMVEVGGGVAAKVSPPFLPLGVGETVGFRLPGYRFKVVDEHDREVSMGGLGELWVKGPGVLTEYWNAPEATAEAVTTDGWLRTGDLVRVGPVGTVMFCGRRKHTIKCGGYSVYPLEVETALEEHPDVVEASVVGIHDERLGEVPAAAVRVRRRSDVTSDELVTWAALRLAEYKAPRRVVIVSELPRTGTEKVQKERLVELFA